MTKTNSDDVLVTHFDHHSRQFAGNAITTVNELREQAPVARSDAYDGFWVVTRHDLVAEAFRDFESFSSKNGASIPALSFGSTHIPTSMDPPDHQIYRRVLTPWFSQSSIRKLEPWIRETVAALVAKLAERGTWDFVPDLADITPGTVTLTILGMAADRQGEFLAAMARGMENQGTTDEELLAEMARDKEWLVAQILREAADRRAAPRDDLMSVLANDELPGGGKVTDAQIVDIVMVLLLAGFHTTSGALTAMLVHLERHPELRERLRAEPERIPDAIEEIVRLYAPATGMARQVTRDREFGGVQLREGDMAFMLIMAASRDPRQFENPDELDLDRSNSKSVAFGWGVHRCLGLHLARTVLRIEMELVFELLPDYEIDLERVRLSHTMGIGYLHESVPARLGGRAS
ncbi:cytochrome P450 [Streptomyces sp. BH-SS-21]|uniref:Cytochrome P450 n=1 Tax=Streptomyces liliiviolaceus TaxID=2823109 RepID=A0A940XW59_9ACTN|nr:cytochrome P450 [Streptomyces liliiviolaceus]MBQ0850778.1 cytochrome P450 [Streptomyces liliiviolaceus]